jgi:hypothetical protein
MFWNLYEPLGEYESNLNRILVKWIEVGLRINYLYGNHYGFARLVNLGDLYGYFVASLMLVDAIGDV